jgi:hypothetical protein
MYDKVQEIVAESYVDASDLHDLVEMIGEGDFDIKRLNGDRRYHLRFLLELVVIPSEELKKQATELLQLLKAGENIGK